MQCTAPWGTGALNCSTSVLDCHCHAVLDCMEHIWRCNTGAVWWSLWQDVSVWKKSAVRSCVELCSVRTASGALHFIAPKGFLEKSKMCWLYRKSQLSSSILVLLKGSKSRWQWVWKTQHWDRNINPPHRIIVHVNSDYTKDILPESSAITSCSWLSPSLHEIIRKW